MSGHSKWSTIKHKKGAADAKRSKIFTKIIREITVATKLGGEDADSNPRLRSAIVLAKSSNMPTDNIKRAIAKGTGNTDGANYEQITYEGYGPHQVAAIVECLTDNKNRTISNIRTAFNKNGGSIGATNSVAYGFDRKGVIVVKKEGITEDELTEQALEAGADDIDTENEESFVVYSEATELHAVHVYLEEHGVTVESAVLAYIPQNKIVIDDLSQAQSVLKFIDALEDDDDVQTVHSNFDISEAVLQQLHEA